MTMFSEMMALPLALQSWLLWLVIINSASLFFLRHQEGRWVLFAWVANIITITALFEWKGYTRLLGLSHVVWWTPLLIYLWRRREATANHGGFSTWLRVLFWTNSVSLAIDYTDVTRYLLGDRAPTM
ncbi:MAG: hypothetical protein OES47_14505 [Acidobacteriota bacterium]|nr:hypothetical protein [Acidobacteriota bacterium]